MEEDGSKFILQIRPPSYWRIELVVSNSTGLDELNLLRSCLASVLLLDQTPCPFKESVLIMLPPESLSVKKRRPWKPLRSYPSEPILGSEAGDVPHKPEDYPREAQWSKETIPENHGGGQESVVAGISQPDSGETRMATNRSPRKVPAIPHCAPEAESEFEHGSSAVVDKPLETAAIPNESLKFISGNEGRLAPGNVINESKAVFCEDETRIKRRHTMDSSWEELGDGFAAHTPTLLHTSQHSFRSTISENEEPPLLKPGRDAEQLGSGGLIQRRVGWSHDGANSKEEKELDPNTDDMLTELARAEDLDATAGIVSRTILLLFYAICGIFVLLWRWVATICRRKTGAEPAPR